MKSTVSKLANVLMICAALVAGLPAADSKFEDLLARAGAGDAETQYLLGCAYMKGDGTAQDYGKAAEILRKAAEQGHAKSQTNMGFLCVNGLGVGKNAEEGVKWYRKAAQQGELQAARNLAQLFERGLGVPKNHKEALHWYRKAAEQGHLLSQYEVGLMLYLGDENLKERDYSESAKWLKMASDRGMPEAWNALGVLLEDGLGIPKDAKAAFEYFLKAAMCGEVKGQANVGRCFALGVGTTRDLVQAYKWLKIGDSKRELTATKVLVGVSLSMTPEQIASGDRLVAEFRPLPVKLQE